MIEFDDHGSFQRFRQELAKAANRLGPELRDEATEQLKAVGAAAKHNAASILPRQGGLARAVSSMVVSVASSGKSSARLSVRSGFDLDSLDRGFVVHPVYGRQPMVTQRVRSGFWSKAVEQSKPRIEAGLNEALERVIKDIH